MLLHKISKAISEPTSLDNYIYIYTYCRKEIETNYPGELDLWKVDALSLFKEKQLFYPLLLILKEAEEEEKEYLLEQIYKEELEKDNLDWNCLFPIMGIVSDGKIEIWAKKYFGDAFSNKNISPEWLGEKVAKVMNGCFHMIEEDYFRIVRGIYSVVKEPQFLCILEHRLKALEKRSNDVRFRMLDYAAAEKYFLFLCENQAYEAANSFIDRIWDENSKKKLFRKETDAVKEMFYRWPSPVLLALGKSYVESRESTYSCEEWIEDIRSTKLKAGSNDEWEAVYQWLKVYRCVSNLREKRNDEALDNLSTTIMYDVHRYSYMTQICCQSAEIIQDWLLDSSLTDEQVIKYLESIGDKNVFSYELYNWYTAPYIGYSGLNKVLKSQELEARLKNIRGVKQLIYIYFNTPMWCRVDFFVFVKLVNEKIGSSGKLADVFDKYLFDGMIIDEDKKTNTGQKRFSIVPKYLYWTRNSKNRAGSSSQSKNQSRYKRVINVAEDWLTRNTEKLNSLSLKKVPDKNILLAKPCQFKIYSLENEVLYAQEVCAVNNAYNYSEESAEENEISFYAKTIFKDNLDRWFLWIIENNQFEKWGKWENANGEINVNVTEPMKVKSDDFTMNERVEIAGRFLDVVSQLAMTNQGEVWKLLHHCSFRPLENINEFRYIETQHWTDFTMTKEQEEELYNLTAGVMENVEIPADLKLEIYMNTCARKVYPLEKLIRNNEEIENILCAKQTEWIVPVTFMEEKEDGTHFSMTSVLDKEGFVDEMKQNVIKSDYDFYYEEKIRECIPEKFSAPEERFVLYATIKEMKENRFELRNYFIDSDAVKRYFPWKEYKKCFYDLKKIKEGETERNQDLFLQVYKNLSKIKYSLSKEGKNSPLDKCKQIVCEMDEVFSNLDFNVEMCKEALLILGEKNPFFDKAFRKVLSEEEASILQEYTQGRYVNEYSSSYDKFLNDVIEKDLSLYDIGVVFYLSHLQFLVSEENFISDIVQTTYRSEEDVKYYLSGVVTRVPDWFEDKKAQMEEIQKEKRLHQQKNPKHKNNNPKNNFKKKKQKKQES